MKSFRKYWETLQNRGDHRTGHRHHFLITFLRRSALALLAFVVVDLATLPPAHALNYDPVCMADCNFLAGGERLQCNIEYERESSGWHECQFIASSNWLVVRHHVSNIQPISHSTRSRLPIIAGLNAMRPRGQEGHATGPQPSEARCKTGGNRALLGDHQGVEEEVETERNCGDQPRNMPSRSPSSTLVRACNNKCSLFCDGIVKLMDHNLIAPQYIVVRIFVNRYGLQSPKRASFWFF